MLRDLDVSWTYSDRCLLDSILLSIHHCITEREKKTTVRYSTTMTVLYMIVSDRQQLTNSIKGKKKTCNFFDGNGWIWVN